MAAFELGKKDLPDLAFDVVDAGRLGCLPGQGRPRGRDRGHLPAQAAEKGEELYDIQAPEEVPVRSYRMLYWLAGALALAGRSPTWRSRAWRRPKRPSRSAPPKEPLEVRTHQALDALRAEDLPGHGAVPRVLLPSLGDPPRLPRRALRVRRAGVHLDGAAGALRRLRTPGLEAGDLPASSTSPTW